jgi:hypothetical protein
MVKITARVTDARMEVGNLSPFARPLGAREFVSQLLQKARILDLLPIRQGDEVAGASLAVEKSGQGFDSVPIGQQHRRKLMRLRALGKTLKLIEGSTFTPRLLKNARSSARNRKSHLKERHFLPGTSAGVSVPRT